MDLEQGGTGSGKGNPIAGWFEDSDRRLGINGAGWLVSPVNKIEPYKLINNGTIVEDRGPDGFKADYWDGDGKGKGKKAIAGTIIRTGDSSSNRIG